MEERKQRSKNARSNLIPQAKSSCRLKLIRIQLYHSKVESKAKIGKKLSTFSFELPNNRNEVLIYDFFFRLLRIFVLFFRFSDRIMYARNQQKPFRPPVTDGEPITAETAIVSTVSVRASRTSCTEKFRILFLWFWQALRTIVFGGCATPPRGEWLRTGFVFREAEKDLAYGLRAPRNGTRGLLSALQAYILKNLLFERKTDSKLSAEEYEIHIRLFYDRLSILKHIKSWKSFVDYCDRIKQSKATRCGNQLAIFYGKLATRGKWRLRYRKKNRTCLIRFRIFKIQ